MKKFIPVLFLSTLLFSCSPAPTTEPSKSAEPTISENSIVSNKSPNYYPNVSQSATPSTAPTVAPSSAASYMPMPAASAAASVAPVSASTAPTSVAGNYVADESIQNQAPSIMKPSTAPNTEQYDKIFENSFLDPYKDPLSTFSIDVDTASYSNIRRFLTSGAKPPKDAVRIEEMINYFTYDYPQPTDGTPFSINIETNTSPWKEGNKIVSIGLQGKKISKDNMPPANIVFLIDTSGSMSDYNKLPLLKEAFKILTKEMREQDKVSIVTYAGSAGLALPPTSGANKDAIISALDNLESRGSTAGAQGIIQAYETAKQSFIKGGNNRVILATDGDFNVGISTDDELVKLIEQKRQEGIFLSVLGFGMGNYKDSKIEKLADKGNGNYAYIDNLNEAKKVFSSQLAGTLLTIAKDVKIQIEFNPAKVKSYRLIGYENRLLNKEDFNDDKKDAGELGAGHTVTALYEIEPNNGSSNVDPLKYQPNTSSDNFKSSEIMTVKFRYKEPNQEQSKLLVKALTDGQNDSFSKNINFASAVAGFGMLLRDSGYKGNLTYAKVLELANKYKDQDIEGYRKEFIDLVSKANEIDNRRY
ncbi:MAG: VWA domain-containing protein [Candidatus Sericytochromatia bacterium]